MCINACLKAEFQKTIGTPTHRHDIKKEHKIGRFSLSTIASHFKTF